MIGNLRTKHFGQAFARREPRRGRGERGEKVGVPNPAELNIRDATGIRNRISQGFDDVALVYVSTVVALTLVYLSFPADPGAGETTANIIAHLTGIVYGFLATTTLVRYTA